MMLAPAAPATHAAPSTHSRMPARRGAGLRARAARLVFALSAWVVLGSSGGCSNIEPGACRDDACPAGQACGLDGRCAPLSVPTATGELGRFTRVGVRPDGRRVVATYDSTNKNLVLVEELDEPVGGATTRRRIIDGFRMEDHALVDIDAGRWASLALDDAGGAHLAWFDGDAGALRYALVPPSGPWSRETVDDGPGNRGTYASLALDVAGAPRIAYRDETAGALRCATRAADGTWTSEVVPACAPNDDACPEAGERDDGLYANLAVGFERLRIVHYDRRAGALVLSERAPDGTWSRSVLDGDGADGRTDGDVGRFACADTDAKRRLGVAYFDATRGALRFFREGGTPLVVDDGVVWDEAHKTQRGHLVGQHVALRFDEAGRAIMLYLDATALTIKRAVVVGTSVTSAEVVPGLAPGGFLSFDLGDAGELLGAYGAWIPGQAPRTQLVLFALPGGGP